MTPIVSQTDLDTEVFGVSLYNWGKFASGLFIGFFLTLGQSSFAGFFSPCNQQRSLVINSGFFFYNYMVTYRDSDFSDSDAMTMMILLFIQFGVGLKMGLCSKDDHGFNDSTGGVTGDTFAGNFLLDIFTLDIEDLKDQANVTDPLSFYISKIYGLFGQTSSSETTDTSTAALIGTIGLLGAAQALTAYNNYLYFNESWIAEKYFEAGAFLGAAIVDGFIILYLFLMAGAVSDSS